jgi:putative two-component system response regulator
LSNRLVVAALRRAQLQARSTDDPLVGLQLLKETHHDLVLLDIEMPGMDGFELCRRLHDLPGYQKTPVIFVTGHSDFESRARSIVSGGDDLIAKPVFPMELAVKAVAYLLKRETTTA